MSRESGDIFERRAAAYLQNDGYTILHTNWYAKKYGEIDIICTQNDVLVFVEVKGRNSRRYAQDGLAAIDRRKVHKLCNAIALYLSTNNIDSTVKVRFDVMVLGEHEIQHIQNVDLSGYLM